MPTHLQYVYFMYGYDSINSDHVRLSVSTWYVQYSKF